MVNAGFFVGQSGVGSAANNLPTMRWTRLSFLLMLTAFFLGPSALTAQDAPLSSSPCRSDLDADGMVAMADMLLMLSDFGQACDWIGSGPGSWPLIQFSELHYNPGSDQGPDHEFEFLELHNPGSVAVDLSGWSLSEGLNVTLPDSTWISGGGFLVITTAPVTYAGLGYPVVDWGTGGLNNSGELLALRAPDGSVVESVEFSDTGGWDSAPDGQGPSLERLHLHLDAHSPEAWEASIGHGGTPGAPNSLWLD